jgi:hypothetical protein
MSHLHDQREGETVTRQEAIERGLVRYFTGEECKHGHVAERYTMSGGCVECVRGIAGRHRDKVRQARERAVE